MLEKKTVSQCVSSDYCRGWNDALTYIQRLEAAQPKWISVEERLPESESIAVGKYGDMLIGTVYFKGGTEYWCENEHEILYNVTHWTPLPSMPKEDA